MSLVSSGGRNLDHDLAVERQICGHEQPAHASTLQLLIYVIAVGEALSEIFKQIVHASRGPRGRR